MIARLRGEIVERDDTSLILDTGGVGYRVFVSSTTLQALQGEEGEITLSIHHHITDSDQRLFGFRQLREKSLFESLITVKGIGPKLALTILSGMDADTLIRAIRAGDIKTLATISGIGKKSAERLSVELKGSIDQLPGSSGEPPRASSGDSSVRLEALDALEALGFPRSDAERWIEQASSKEPEATVSQLVRAALSYKP